MGCREPLNHTKSCIIVFATIFEELKLEKMLNTLKQSLGSNGLELLKSPTTEAYTEITVNTNNSPSLWSLYKKWTQIVLVKTLFAT